MVTRQQTNAHELKCQPTIELRLFCATRFRSVARKRSKATPTNTTIIEITIRPDKKRIEHQHQHQHCSSFHRNYPSLTCMHNIYYYYYISLSSGALPYFVSFGLGIFFSADLVLCHFVSFCRVCVSAFPFLCFFFIMYLNLVLVRSFVRFFSDAIFSIAKLP